MQTADWIALASLVVALAALAVAFYAIYKGNRNSSVATLVTLNDGFRQAWSRFISAVKAEDEEAKYFELAELMNLLEIACGIQSEKSLSGMSNQVVKDYLEQALKLLIGNEYTNQQIPQMLHQPSTFINIKKFINAKRSHLSVVIPPEWYQA